MTRAATRLAIGVVSLVAIAPAFSALGRGSSLNRPLHLPRIAAGERCPTTRGMLASALARGLARMPAAGIGPVYLLSVAGDPAGSMTIARSVADAQGWKGQKAPWLASPGYRGPILIRGARIDGSGGVRFARASGDHLRELYQRRGQGVQQNGWRAWPGALLVRAPGCYALQVDGTSFSSVIVVRVHA